MTHRDNILAAITAEEERQQLKWSDDSCFTTHDGANYYYMSTSRDRRGATSYPADHQWIADEGESRSTGFVVPGYGEIPWVHSLNFGKIRRRVEDRLRKSNEKEILRIALLLDVKLS